jgi:hypothetical protein
VVWVSACFLTTLNISFSKVTIAFYAINLPNYVVTFFQITKCLIQAFKTCTCLCCHKSTSLLAVSLIVDT